MSVFVAFQSINNCDNVATATAPARFVRGEKRGTISAESGWVVLAFPYLLRADCEKQDKRREKQQKLKKRRVDAGSRGFCEAFATNYLHATVRGSKQKVEGRQGNAAKCSMRKGLTKPKIAIFFIKKKLHFEKREGEQKNPENILLPSA